MPQSKDPHFVLSCGGFKSHLQDAHALLNHRLKRRRSLIGKQIGNPHHPALSAVLREDLYRSVVVRETSSNRRPGETGRLGVDDRFLGPSSRFQRSRFLRRARARHQARMQRANVANCVPHRLRICSAYDPFQIEAIMSLLSLRILQHADQFLLAFAIW